jgi:transposase
MLSPTGWWLITEPIDLRCGMDRLLVYVSQTLRRDPFEGGAYVFRNRAASRIKVLHADVQGVWLAVRRLQEGHFTWPRSDETMWSLSEAQFAWLCAGVDWRRLSDVKRVAQQL